MEAPSPRPRWERYRTQRETRPPRRPLTPEEIEGIVRDIPAIPSPMSQAGAVAQQGIVNRIRLMLAKAPPIVPSEIPNLKTEILRQISASIIRPGTMVGHLASEALSSQLSQQTLSSQHTAGSSARAITSVDLMKEILNASDKRKFPVTHIYFRENLSPEDILRRKRAELVGITVRDVLLTDPVVDTPEDAFGENPWWHANYRLLAGREPKASYVARLTLDPVMLVRHHIRPEDVALAIERKSPPAVMVVPSPAIMEATKAFVSGAEVPVDSPTFYLDVFPVEGEIRRARESSDVRGPIGLVFLKTVFVPLLDRVQIKGVSGIRAIHPARVLVTHIIDAEIPTADPMVWDIYLSARRSLASNVTRARVASFLAFLGMSIEATASPDILRVRLPPRPPDLEIVLKGTAPYGPSRLIAYRTRIDTRADTDSQRERRELLRRLVKEDKQAALRLSLVLPQSDFSRNAYLHYADAEGYNLVELLNRDDIDPYHTISNNPREVLETLGIEAARNVIMGELRAFIEGTGGKTNVRHIALLASFMTSRGWLSKITYTGMKAQQQVGIMSLSGFERPVEVLTTYGAVGSTEPVVGVSGSIFVGKRAAIGPEYRQEPIDPALRRRLEVEAAKATAGEEPEQIDPAEFGLLEETEFSPEIATEAGERRVRQVTSAVMQPIYPGYDEPKPDIVPASPVSDALLSALSGVSFAPCLPEIREDEFRIEPLTHGTDVTPFPSTEAPATVLVPVTTTIRFPNPTATGGGIPVALRTSMDLAARGVPVTIPSPTPRSTLRTPSASDVDAFLAEED